MIPISPGHTAILDVFDSSSGVSSCPTSWIFFGPQGVGKGDLVTQIANSLLGKKDIKNHPDSFIIDHDEKAISIDEIRQLTTFVSKTAFLGGNKVIIIDDAHRMTGAAQNALLKTLEEPPLNTYIFLTTDQLHKLLPTVRSRCVKQTIAFLSKSDLEKRIDDINSNVSSQEKDFILSFSKGCPGQLQYALDNKLFELYQLFLNYVQKGVSAPQDIMVYTDQFLNQEEIKKQQPSFVFEQLLTFYHHLIQTYLGKKDYWHPQEDMVLTDKKMQSRMSHWVRSWQNMNENYKNMVDKYLDPKSLLFLSLVEFFNGEEIK